MAELREYNQATTILFPLVDFGATDFESTPVTFAAGDTQILKDEGTFANATNNPVHEGNGLYSLALTATEMQAGRIVVSIVDQTATKEWEDQAVSIETYGNASGEHAFNLNSATPDVNVAQVSGDATAADNLELMYDGTGYNDDTAPASRSQVAGISGGSGGALNFANEADNVDAPIKSISFDGTETAGTNASVNTEDATWHQITHATNNIDIVYQFDVGGGRTAVELTWKGRLVGTNDQMTIQAYNGTGWDTVKVVDGHSNSAPAAVGDNASEVIPLLSSHTGTGADLGKVFIRLECAAQSSPVLYTDLLLVSAVNVGQSVGYALGAVWVDTTNGVAGTESFVNGVADNPVLSWADAQTIADNVGLSRFVLTPGSSITFDATISATFMDNKTVFAYGSTVALGGRSVSWTRIEGAMITGNDDGSNGTPTNYVGCEMGNNTLGQHVLSGCRLGGAITLAEAGDYFWDSCYSAVAGTGTPSVDFEAAAENKNLSVRHYSGGLEYVNFGNTGTHTGSLEGQGQAVLAASCGANGTLAIRGTFTLTDNAGGVVTVSDDARVDIPQIWGAPEGGYPANTVGDNALFVHNQLDNSNAAGMHALIKRALLMVDTTISGAPTSDSQFILAAGSADDDAYNGMLCVIQDGTTEAQQSVGVIIDYIGATKEVFLAADAVFTLAASDRVTIVPFAPLLGLSAGTMVAGTTDNTGFVATSTILESDDITEATDDHYIGRTIAFLSGALKGQATDITDYTLNGGRGRFTYTALTEAPPDNSIFVII